MGNYDKTALNESRLWLAEAKYREGDFKEASKYQQEYVKAIDKSDENFGLAQYNLGYSLYEQKRYSEAKSAFQNAVASKQLSSDLMADAYNRIGDTQYYARDFGGVLRPGHATGQEHQRRLLDVSKRHDDGPQPPVCR